MTHRKLDSVQQIATGTGTGVLTLGAATAANYRTMQAAGMNNADTGTFRIQHETILAEWEQVLVTYSAGAITRTFDTNSTSATGALINFSAGNKIVSCVLRAGDAVVMDNNGDVAVTRDAAIGRNATVAGALTVGANSPLTHRIKANNDTAVGIYSDAANQVTFEAVRASSEATKYDFYFNKYGGNSLFGGSLTVASSISASAIGLGIASNGYLLRAYNGSDAAEYSAAAFQSVANPSGVSYTYLALEKGLGYGGVIAGYLSQGVGSGIAIGVLNASVLTKIVEIETTNEVRPYSDNTIKLGSASKRWSVVYSATGAINTSGRGAKMFVSAADAAEKRAAKTIKAKPRRYKLKDSVDQKGEALARWHFGYVAEDVRDALAAEELDPWAYAFLCSDPLIKRETYFETATRTKMRKVERAENVVEVREGRPVLVRKVVEHDEPVGTEFAVLDEEGQPVLNQVGATEDGSPIFAPLMHLVPEMEEYQVERTREVDTGEVRLGLRYSELEAFLRSAD